MNILLQKLPPQLINLQQTYSLAMTPGSAALTPSILPTPHALTFPTANILSPCPICLLLLIIYIFHFSHILFSYNDFGYHF